MTMNLFDQNKKYEPFYFNTTGLKGAELKEKQERVFGQNAKVLEVFAGNPTVKFTPWHIYERLHGKAPITSVRRAITTLEAKGFLIKSETTVKAGPYASNSFTWMLHPNQLRK